MFYTMTRDLLEARFSPPRFTTYNDLQIPYAYPPLGFFLGAFLNEVTGIPIIKIIQWMPLVFNLLTIPVFFTFLKRLLNSEPAAALATLVYALTPNSYWWTIVGGGLTRSPGTFFFMLTLFSVYQMYKEKKPIWVIASALSGTLVVLSHLTWAMQTVVAVFLLWLFFGRNRQGTLHSFIVGMAVLLLTSPWWLMSISVHGMDVFIQAFQVNHSRWLAWTFLFALSFTGESTPVIAVFALAGLFIHLARRNYFFVLWALLCLLSDPRGGAYASIFPFAVLAASALSDGVAVWLGKQAPAEHEAWISSLDSRTGKAFWGFFIILFLYNAYSVSTRLSQEKLNADQREALEWIRMNTAADASFIVFDEQGNPLLSPFVEWFPALSERHSLTTIQGTEWLNGELHYNQQIPVITDLRACLVQDIECVTRQSKGMDVDYIVISSFSQVPLITSLQNTGMELAYRSENVSVYRFEK